MSALGDLFVPSSESFYNVALLLLARLAYIIGFD
jgi:hypothetical protein